MGDCHNGAGGEKRRGFWAQEGKELCRGAQRAGRQRGLEFRVGSQLGGRGVKAQGSAAEAGLTGQAPEAPEALGGNGRTRLACQITQAVCAEAQPEEDQQAQCSKNKNR